MGINCAARSDTGNPSITRDLACRLDETRNDLRRLQRSQPFLLALGFFTLGLGLRVSFALQFRCDKFEMAKRYGVKVEIGRQA